MTYGDYEFSPVPMVTIGKQYNKRGDGRRIGALLNVGLDGTLTPLPTGVAGFTNTIGKMNELRDALNQDGCPFVIKCDTTVLWSGNPRVGDINFGETNNNWTQSISYNLDLEFDDELNNEDSVLSPSTTPAYIEEFSDTWSMEFGEDVVKYDWNLPTVGRDASPSILRVTHEISAKGKTHYTDCGTAVDAWYGARSYVSSGLSGGITSPNQDDYWEQLQSNLILNISTGNFPIPYNHMRNNNIDKAGGTCSVSESWLVLETGVGIAGNAIEDFTINSQQSVDDNLTTISIDGTIQGLETRSYWSNPSADNFTIAETKYTSASGYWDTIKGRLLYRAQLVNDTLDKPLGVRSLHTRPKSLSVGHSPTKGVISYNYTFDDRPSNCITGALSEIITFNDNNPTDVFAEVAVLGRQLGPVLQDVNTVTASTRDISIELVTAPSTSCSAGMRVIPNDVRSDVEDLLCLIQTELATAYTQVFKNTDTENWNAKQGRYTRNVGWTYQSCLVTPDTSFC